METLEIWVGKDIFMDYVSYSNPPFPSFSPMFKNLMKNDDEDVCMNAPLPFSIIDMAAYT